MPLIAAADICVENQALMHFLEQDRVASDFFDSYYITRKNGVYHIYCNKRIRLQFSTLTWVMEGHEEYPKFMPGYKAIKVERNSEGKLFTAIKFRASFSPFTSRFTTQVETSNKEFEYRQCWLQLDRNDSRVIEEFKSAPRVNQGFWLLVKLDDGIIEMNYFSAIQPPVSIPGWLYKKIIKGSYEDVFEAIISRVQSTPSLID